MEGWAGAAGQIIHRPRGGGGGGGGGGSGHVIADLLYDDILSLYASIDRYIHTYKSRDRYRYGPDWHALLSPPRLILYTRDRDTGGAWTGPLALALPHHTRHLTYGDDDAIGIYSRRTCHCQQTRNDCISRQCLVPPSVTQPHTLIHHASNAARLLVCLTLIYITVFEAPPILLAADCAPLPTEAQPPKQQRPRPHPSPLSIYTNISLSVFIIDIHTYNLALPVVTPRRYT